MRILLTGAGGFLGRRVAPLLVDVVPLHRSDADIADAAAVRAARDRLGAVDVIVHLAAYVPRRAADDDSTRATVVNANGTANVLAAWSDAAHVVYASTVEVYGLSRHHGPIREDAPTDPVTAYGVSKLEGERIAQELRGSTLTVLRLASLYGAGDEIDRALPRFAHAAVSGDALEVHGGEELRDWLHADDAAAAIAAAAERRPPGVFNIGSGVGVSIIDAAHIVSRLANSASEIRVGARRRPAVDLVLDVSAARGALGFAPRSFPEGFEEQLEWALRMRS